MASDGSSEFSADSVVLIPAKPPALSVFRASPSAKLASDSAERGLVEDVAQKLHSYLLDTVCQSFLDPNRIPFDPGLQSGASAPAFGQPPVSLVGATSMLPALPPPLPLPLAQFVHPSFAI